ncbi:hypothetical protein RINTHM_1250 [Richelia intracellularis HM01]|nr:hypothetical protein RINTHM_1250 [Richelia intracellularis HM01]
MSKRPKLAATIPLPILETTPPVTKTNLVMIFNISITYKINTF